MNLIGTSRKSLAVITGAYGGTGRAVARRLGVRYRLVLSGRNEVALAALHDSLTEEGYDIALSVATDVASPDSVQRLAAAVGEAGTLGTLVHTAGLSPALAGPRTIVEVNLRGTAHLLDAFLPLAVPGSSAVCIGSVAAHTFSSSAEVDAVLDDPHAGGLAVELERLLLAADPNPTPYFFAVRAYGASKRGVLRLVERSAGAWAERGARILSVSPGTVLTPMGRQEMAANPLAAAAAEVTPLRRLGMPADIAAAIDFLVSDSASYITGCDLRVDGGIVAARRHPAAAPRPASQPTPVSEPHVTLDPA
ncbi:SDR family oxidoreductase [Frankia sp. Mgl5]|uniref:SDR family oxidoreductase n=1 Tax=Frankia sp. Mgl5 TaxID=2933793 RepID=UPI00200D71AE|nr:SDR family oxidoreductase [Frankia sp. Mgl5]